MAKTSDPEGSEEARDAAWARVRKLMEASGQDVHALLQQAEAQAPVERWSKEAEVTGWKPRPVAPVAALAVVAAPAALAMPSAQPTLDPVTVYLSRYTSKHSRLAMTASLRVIARLLLGHDADPRTVPWPTIRYSHAQAVRTKLSAQYAWASTNRHLLALRGVMQECWRLGLVEHEVYLRIADVESLKPTHREVGRALKDAELVALYAACDETAAGRRDATILTLTANAGLRRSEVRALDLSNWDVSERNKLQVLGKGNKWRTIFLSPNSGRIVESWLKLRGHDAGPLLVAVDAAGQPVSRKRLSTTGLYVILQRLATRAKVADFTPHDLRRTFITRLLGKGADALTVSKLVGHENVQTTIGYDRRGDAAKQKAMDLLDDE